MTRVVFRWNFLRLVRHSSLSNGLGRRQFVFSLGDEPSGHNKPAIITLCLIAINVLVFVVLQGMGANEKFTCAFSTIPYEILLGCTAQRSTASGGIR
jgi:hypothetical protein